MQLKRTIGGWVAALIVFGNVTAHASEQKLSVHNISLGGQIVLAEEMEGAAIDGFVTVAGYELENGGGEVEIFYQWFRSVQ